MESGEPTLTLGYILAATAGNLDLIKACLGQWQKEGRIEWLKPLDPMNPAAEVVRFRTYITKDVPWPR